MTCPNVEKWNQLSMDLVSEAERVALLTHAHECEGCRLALGRARRDHIGLLRAFEVFDQNHDELRNELLATLPVHIAPPRPRLVRAWQSLGGLLLTPNMTPRRVAFMLAPAACILIAVGIFLIPAKSAVAFAAVIEQMRQARTMVCDVALTVTYEIDEVIAAQIEKEDGAAPAPTERTTRGTLSMYSDGKTRAWLLERADGSLRKLTLPNRTIETRNGKHSVMKLTDDPNTPGLIESPEVWLRRLLELADEPDRELGRDLIDDRTVVGFEIAASRLDLGILSPVGREPSSGLRLWVDVETRLPVRLEYDVVYEFGLGTRRTEGWWDRMQWDVPLDPKAFEPPAIEEVDEVIDLGMPPATEEALLAGLRTYAEQSAKIAEALAAAEQVAKDDPDRAAMLAGMRKWVHADSAYPEGLEFQTLLSVVSVRHLVLRARRAQVQARRAKEVQEGDLESQKERWAAEDERMSREKEEVMRAVGGAALFYRKLVMEDREPEYLGEAVEPGDGSAVLIRWKLDDQHMRVIYGDLRVETVPIKD